MAADLIKKVLAFPLSSLNFKGLSFCFEGLTYVYMFLSFWCWWHFRFILINILEWALLCQPVFHAPELKRFIRHDVFKTKLPWLYSLRFQKLLNNLNSVETRNFFTCVYFCFHKWQLRERTLAQWIMKMVKNRRNG